MIKQKKQAFTLVELIVVITILAILGTIAFISLQGYAASARDSKRVSDIQNIKKSLELFTLNTSVYPLPDNGFDVLYSGSTIWTQGILGDIVSMNLSRNLNEKPTDPLTGLEYIYSVVNTKKEYELLSFYESNLVSYNNLSNQTQADSVYPKIDGTYNQIFVKTDDYIIPVPSIINSEVNESSIILDENNIKSQIITGGSNNILYGLQQAQTGKLDINLSVFSGSITNNSDNGKTDLANKIITAYSGSILEEIDIYKEIIEASEAEKLVIINLIVLNKSVTNIVETDWRDIDPNCDIPDIIIGTQTWAGCNSTIGNGLEWGQLDSDMGTNNYNGQIGSCYPDYPGNNTPSACPKGDLSMASTTKANTWFSGTNTNLDTEVDNIWGKLYTWDNISSACGNGYHVPTDAEWEYVEEYLYEEKGGDPNCRTGDGAQCANIGWKFHSTTNSGSNLVEILKIPLAGDLNNQPAFEGRGTSAFIWTSTEYDATNAKGRFIHSVWTTIYRAHRSKSTAYTVRCLKD